ncbi:hypothetical protein KVR01_007127 [Diaporthe batatas]|uniref:uncharacterized protein n=1 Tax=Diaporthe batatas TaxID=748121 RepID=UPI001D04B38F|nr:uncharacterized protein KVR01_007127 [Diaporthe batatas]KAG8162649.1 hypothetical protein KVR01_007127 [Diaporthe batatas]
MGRYIDPNVSSGVNLGFTALMIVPLIVIMCITYRRAPRAADPARGAVPYFKVVLPVTTAWIVLYTIAGILGIVLGNALSSWEARMVMQEAQLRISTIASLGARLADFLMIMTLVEMGNGFLFCLAEMRTGLQKAMKYVGIGSCAILAILAVALFGITNALYSAYFGQNGLYYEDSERLYDARKGISSALTIVVFIWSLVLVVFAAIVFTKAKRNHVLRNSAMLFLIATVLYFISNLYLLIYTALFVLSNFYPYDSYETYTALLFIDPIVVTWTFVIASSLVCAVVVRKNNGLWSTLQPWMNEQIPPALAANANYKGHGEQWQQPSNNHVMGV